MQDDPVLRANSIWSQTRLLTKRGMVNDLANVMLEDMIDYFACVTHDNKRFYVPY